MYDKTAPYLKEYDTIPAPTDPQAQIAARLPAALFYWLAETARRAGKWDEAEIYYSRVTQHPDPGDLLAGAWWQLGEVQSHRKEWPAAVASYEKYRQLKPDAKDATMVLLALGRAQLGAQNFDAAKKLGDQALLQEPEGPEQRRRADASGRNGLCHAKLSRGGAGFRHAGGSFRRSQDHAAGHVARGGCFREGRRCQVGGGLAAKAEG